MSLTPFTIDAGTMPRSVLWAIWISRRRFVSPIAVRIASVSRSAYITTRPSLLRAARPMVWISEVVERR